MNQATRAVAPSFPVTTMPALPRSSRLGSAIASATVTCALFGAVVLGMTSPAEGGAQLVAQARAVART